MICHGLTTASEDWARFRPGLFMALTCGFRLWAARDSNPARRIKSPELYLMS